MDDDGFDSAWQCADAPRKSVSASGAAKRVRPQVLRSGSSAEAATQRPRKRAAQKQSSHPESDFVEEAVAVITVPKTTLKSNACKVDLGAGSSLQIAAAVAPSRGDTRTIYELDGADADKVRGRLSQAKCQCKTIPCFRAITFKVLLQICITFWSLTSCERAMLLREAYHNAQGQRDEQEALEVSAEPSTSMRGPKISWSLCGQPVCFKMFCHLLGTGTVTTRNALHGKPDMRHTVVQGIHMETSRAKPQSQVVDAFFFIICTDPLLSHCLKTHAAEMSDNSLMWMSALQTHTNKIQTF